MGNFNRDSDRGSSFGHNNFNDRNSGGRGPSVMYKTICSQCGNECEVPFRPNGSKPVLCSNCFQASGGGRNNESRNFDRPQSNFDRPRFGSRSNSNGGDKPMYDAICDKCGNSCKIPFQPNGSRPVYCSSCFEEEGKPGSKHEGNEKMDAINAKLDQILNILNTAISEEAAQTEHYQPAVEAMSEVSDIVPQDNKKPKSAKKSPSKKKA